MTLHQDSRMPSSFATCSFEHRRAIHFCSTMVRGAIAVCKLGDAERGIFPAPFSDVISQGERERAFDV